MKHRRSFSFLKKSRRYRFSDIAYLIFSSAVRFFSAPYVKIIVLITAAVCILMIPVPYLITKIIPGDSIQKSNDPNNTSFELTDTPESISVYRCDSKKTESVDFEEYIKGVVSGEMPSTFHIQALKAQAVAARTYSLARVIRAEKNGNPKAHPDAPLCDSTHCQVYRSPSELKDLKGEKWMEDGWNKISKAVDDTEGELLYYDGNLVEQALFHSSSGGKTENSEDVFASAVPYLVSVESPYEDEATHKNEKNSFSIDEFSSKIKKACPSIDFGSITSSNIRIISRSSGGRVEKMQIGNGVIEGRNVREALGLPSANFEIKTTDDTITFTSNGSGHGVGMSQYGANGMAKEGYDYKKILSHYYSGTEVH